MAIVDKDLTYYMRRNAEGKFKHIEERPEIDRSELRRILADSLPEGTIRWGCRLKTIEGDTIVFKDDSTASGFDLIVGADGAWSKVRKVIDPDLVPVHSGVGMFELEVPDAEKSAPEAYELVNRGSVFASAEGQRLSIQQMGDGSLSIYASFVTNDAEWMKPEKFGCDTTNLEAVIPVLLETKYKDWCPSLRAVLPKCKGKCIPRSLFMLPVGSTWTHKRGLTLIGDAAHLMTPYAGEGVNQAFDDAMILARAIASTADDDEALDAAVARYEADMYARVHKVQELTEGLLKDWMFTPGAPRSVMAKSMSRHVRHALPWALQPLGTAAVHAYYFLYNLRT